jgi:hypothetical protein
VLDAAQFSFAFAAKAQELVVTILPPARTVRSSCALEFRGRPQRERHPIWSRVT